LIGRLAAPAALIGLWATAEAQQPGEQDFQTFCSPCHSIGGGRLVGPDLAGVGDRRSVEWLNEFVRSSQAMVARGDPDAVALVAEYSNIVMPDAPLSEAQIAGVVAYMTAAGASSSAITPQAPSPSAASAAEGDAERGRDLFEGRARFANGGPACSACHDAAGPDVSAGGSLSVDLSTAYSRLSGPGIEALLVQPPFPVMQAAYAERGITIDERLAVIAFLAGRDQGMAVPTNHGLRLLLSGSTGAAALFGFFSFVWRGRKREPVNKGIFDRQGRATWED